MTPDHLGLIAAGAAVVVLLLVMVVAAVALVVHQHEVRELRYEAERHADIVGQLGDLRRLTLNAINGRAQLEQDVATLRVKVKDLDDRVIALEGL